jgi:hypothetical protein
LSSVNVRVVLDIGPSIRLTFPRLILGQRSYSEPRVYRLAGLRCRRSFCVVYLMLVVLVVVVIVEKRWSWIARSISYSKSTYDVRVEVNPVHVIDSGLPSTVRSDCLTPTAQVGQFPVRQHKMRDM